MAVAITRLAHRPTTPGVPVWLAVALFAAGLIAGGGGAAWLTGWRADYHEQGAVPAGPPPSADRRFSRDEFRAAVLGRSADQVVEAVGRPRSTGSGAGEEQTWYYGGSTIDPVTGHPDRFTSVTFRDGRVIGVRF
ncbi:MAG: hypothetical protein U0871_03515 [Gemmataceae bacterium]